MIPAKEKPPQQSSGSNHEIPEVNKPSAKSTRLLKSQGHPGFSGLKSEVGVYRCKLFPQRYKRNRKYADYKGELVLANCKVSILVWIHEDSTLGLRLEKITGDGK
jgi:hypothetical protein